MSEAHPNRGGFGGRSAPDLRSRFIGRAGLPGEPSLWELVGAVREIPFGRPTEKTPEGVVAEWKGTCSTKHALLAELLSGRPEFDLQLVHRVYRLQPEEAREMFGDKVADTVPHRGLIDVHTYATVLVAGQRLKIDVTFPGPAIWDGRSDMPLACGDGHDYPADSDPWALKKELIAAHCDPDVRGPFIEALTDR